MSHDRPSSTRARRRVALAAIALACCAAPAPAVAGMLPVANGIATYGTPDELMPEAAGPAGDVNGDGFDDVLTAPTPRAFEIKLGSAERTLASPSAPTWVIRVPDDAINASASEIALPIGDFNGDGRDDLFVTREAESARDASAQPVRASIVFGAAAPGEVTLPSATASVSVENGPSKSKYFDDLWPVGDVDDDGYDDLVAIFSSDLAAVIYGGPIQPGTVLDVSARGPRWTAITGFKVRGPNYGLINSYPVALGDTNGDGFGDFAFRHKESDTVEWTYVVLGGRTRADIGLLAAQRAGRAYRIGPLRSPTDGGPITPLGDFNGDGLDDLAVSRTNTSMTIIRGRTAVRDIAITQERQTTNWAFRTGSISAVPPGDVNGDGYDDPVAVVVREGGLSRTYGGGFAFLGGPGAGNVVVPSATAAIEFTNAGSLGGGRVFAAGDLDGDGHADVGVPGRGIAYGYGPGTQPAPDVPPALSFERLITTYEVGTCSIFRSRYVKAAQVVMRASEPVNLTYTATQPGQPTRTITTPGYNAPSNTLTSRLISGALGTVTVTVVATDQGGLKSEPVSFDVPVLQGPHLANINFGFGCPPVV